jgi:hypothetical protein
MVGAALRTHAFIGHNDSLSLIQGKPFRIRPASLSPSGQTLELPLQINN